MSARVNLRGTGAALLFAAVVAAFAHPAMAGCVLTVEEDARWASASLRVQGGASACRFSEAQYRETVRSWLGARPADASPVGSLFLGRAVEYPWLSRHVADAALAQSDWPARVRAARPGERHALAAPLFRDPALLARLALPFEGTPLRVTGISTEKILYGRAADHASDPAAGELRVPFDAQIWLSLAPAQAPAR